MLLFNWQYSYFVREVCVCILETVLVYFFTYLYIFLIWKVFVSMCYTSYTQHIKCTRVTHTIFNFHKRKFKIKQNGKLEFAKIKTKPVTTTTITNTQWTKCCFIYYIFCFVFFFFFFRGPYNRILYTRVPH